MYGWKIFIRTNKTGKVYVSIIRFRGASDAPIRTNDLIESTNTEVGSVMSSSPTKHNQGVGPARSLFLETGFRQPTTGGGYAEYTERVRQIAGGIIDGFGLSKQQIDHLRQMPLASDAMAREVPNQLAPEWTVALQVISAPELYGSATTIQDVTASVIPELLQSVP